MNWRFCSLILQNKVRTTIIGFWKKSKWLREETWTSRENTEIAARKKRKLTNYENVDPFLFCHSNNVMFWSYLTPCAFSLVGRHKCNSSWVSETDSCHFLLARIAFSLILQWSDVGQVQKRSCLCGSNPQSPFHKAKDNCTLPA